jgi:hypothetical protein
MPGEPNPDAIVWYLRRSESLLSDLRERIRSLRVRGAQLAGFSGAVLALAGTNVDSVLEALHGGARALAGGSLLLGLLLLVLSLVIVLRGTVLPESISALSAKEVANYTTERFTCESDLWRVHQRTILGLLDVIESSAAQEDQAARAGKKAEYFLFAGLFTVAVAFATLTAVVTF